MELQLVLLYLQVWSRLQQALVYQIVQWYNSYVTDLTEEIIVIQNKLK